MPRPLPTPSSTGIDSDPAERMHDKFPKGQFAGSVTETAGKSVSPDGKPKRAKHHRPSKEMRHAIKRGLVSESALKKATGSTPGRAKHYGNRDTSQSKESGARASVVLDKVHGNRG